MFNTPALVRLVTDEKYAIYGAPQFFRAEMFGSQGVGVQACKDARQATTTMNYGIYAEKTFVVQLATSYLLYINPVEKAIVLKSFQA